MTKSISEILKEFDNTKFVKYGGSCFECCDYEGMYLDLQQFIRQQLEELLDSCPIPDSWSVCKNDKWFIKNLNEWAKKLKS